MSRESEQGQPLVGACTPYTDQDGQTFYLGEWPNVFNLHEVSPPAESREHEARRLAGGEPRAFSHGEHIRSEKTQKDVEAYNRDLASQLRGRLLLESSDPQML